MNKIRSLFLLVACPIIVATPILLIASCSSSKEATNGVPNINSVPEINFKINPDTSKLKNQDFYSLENKTFTNQNFNDNKVLHALINNFSGQGFSNFTCKAIQSGTKSNSFLMKFKFDQLSTEVPYKIIIENPIKVDVPSDEVITLNSEDKYNGNIKILPSEVENDPLLKHMKIEGDYSYLTITMSGIDTNFALETSNNNRQITLNFYDNYKDWIDTIRFEVKIIIGKPDDKFNLQLIKENQILVIPTNDLSLKYNGRFQFKETNKFIDMNFIKTLIGTYDYFTIKCNDPKVTVEVYRDEKIISTRTQDRPFKKMNINIKLREDSLIRSFKENDLKKLDKKSFTKNSWNKNDVLNELILNIYDPSGQYDYFIVKIDYILNFAKLTLDFYLSNKIILTYEITSIEVTPDFLVRFTSENDLISLTNSNFTSFKNNVNKKIDSNEIHSNDFLKKIITQIDENFDYLKYNYEKLENDKYQLTFEFHKNNNTTKSFNENKTYRIMSKYEDNKWDNKKIKNIYHTSRKIISSKKRAPVETYTMEEIKSLSGVNYTQNKWFGNYKTTANKDWNTKGLIYDSAQRLHNKLYDGGSFNSCDPTINTIKKHPGADLQYGPTDANTPSVKKGFILDKDHHGNAGLGLELVAGEYAKISFPDLSDADVASLDLSIHINTQERPRNKYPTKEEFQNKPAIMPYVYKKFKVTHNNFYFASPWSGDISVTFTNHKHDLNFIVDGAIEEFEYIHNYTTAKDWNSQVKRVKGHFVYFTNDFMELITQSRYFSDKSYPYKNMDIINNIFQIGQYVIHGDMNRSDHYMLAGCSWIDHGGAFSSGSRVTAPPSWYNKFLSYNNNLNSPSWGIYHEINHGYEKSGRKNWPWGFENYGTDKNNNALTTIEWNLYSMLAQKRFKSDGKTSSNFGGGNRFQLAALSMHELLGKRFSGSTKEEIYAVLMHSIGIKDTLRFIGSYDTVWLPPTNNGYYVRVLDAAARLAAISGFDFRTILFDIYGGDTTTKLNELNKFPKYNNYLNDGLKSGKFKKFVYGVSSYTSQIVNSVGTAVKTMKPFRFDAKVDFSFNFTKDSVYWGGSGGINGHWRPSMADNGIKVSQPYDYVNLDPTDLTKIAARNYKYKFNAAHTDPEKLIEFKIDFDILQKPNLRVRNQDITGDGLYQKTTQIIQFAVDSPDFHSYQFLPQENSVEQMFAANQTKGSEIISPNALEINPNSDWQLLRDVKAQYDNLLYEAKYEDQVLEFNFNNCSSFNIQSNKDITYGKMDLYINDVFIQTIDLSDSSGNNVIVYTSPANQSATNLRIKLVNKFNNPINITSLVKNS